jgi:hypothetical protein
MNDTTPLSFSYDIERDVLTIEGLQYSGDLFREFSVGLQLNTPFEIVKRDNVITIHRIDWADHE